MNTHWTIARWHVRPGEEDEFVRVWMGELTTHFKTLDKPPVWGKLLRSTQDRQLFYSLGPWDHIDDILAMRAHPDSQTVLGKLAAMCDDFAAGPYEEIATG